MPGAWGVFAPGDLKLEGLGSQSKLTVACVVTTIMVATMKRAAAALSFTKQQFANVARHLAHLATGCSIDSIAQALQPKRRNSRPKLTDLELLLSTALEPEDLEPSVLAIIKDLGVSSSFPSSVLQPQAVAVQRIRAAYKSMNDALLALLTDENAAENEAENALLSTPAPKHTKKVALSAEWCGSEEFEDEFRSSEDKLKSQVKSELKSMLQSIQKSQAEAVSLQARQFTDLAESLQTEFGEVTKRIDFNTNQQLNGFNRVTRDLGDVKAIGVQNLQSSADLQNRLKVMGQAAADHYDAQRIHREAQQRHREAAQRAREEQQRDREELQRERDEAAAYRARGETSMALLREMASVESDAFTSVLEQAR